jgi:cell fate regulator YaaT (PSP1 superfamily)
MTTVVGVKFKKTSKLYYFGPGGIDCTVGDAVVVETARGTEIGEVVMPPMELDDDKIVAPLKNIVRKVSERDLQLADKSKSQEADAFRIFAEKITEYKLDMKPVEVEYAFDGSKITFYFTADGRVDFRELVKGLAHQFRSRIELRQIGVRDEAKMLGGLGKCGCPICCRQFLPNFTPVSIKMAKEQNISLNPNKISGLCGRLMCCLNFEQGYYEQMRKLMPRVGLHVSTKTGRGVVLENNYLTGKVKVRVERDDGVIEVTDVPYETLMPDGAKAALATPSGEAAQALQANPQAPVKPQQPQSKTPPVQRTDRSASALAPAAPKDAAVAESQKPRRNSRRRRRGGGGTNKQQQPT